MPKEKLELPEYIDVKMPIGAQIVITEPGSNVEILALAAHLKDGWVEHYVTAPCSPDDPKCIKFGKIPLGKKFYTNEKGEKAIMKVRTSFDVRDAFTNDLLAQVRV